MLNVQVPQIFKNVIDSFNLELTSDATIWVVGGSLILGCTCLSLLELKMYEIFRPPFFNSDGLARVGATLSGELLNVVFSNIGQKAVTRVALETFEHLLRLDLKFHLSKQTGGLTRAIDRGTKYLSFFFLVHVALLLLMRLLRGITFMLQALIFRIVPTAFEITLVCGILVRLFLSYGKLIFNASLI